MILSEPEAKTKWCPFARAVEEYEYVSGGTAHYGTIVANRGGKLDEKSRCLGSGCMAWQPFPDHPTPYGTCGLTR